MTDFTGRKRHPLLSRLMAALSLLSMVFLVSSCYVPNDFVAEIRLSRNGDYVLTYKGNLTWAPLYKDIREGTIDREEIARREKSVIDDLERDGAFKSVTPLGSGTFKVFYENKGRFTETAAVTFVRRGSPLLTMETKPDGTVHIWSGQDPKLRDPAQLEALGLRTQGKLRVITDIAVTRHNAWKVTDMGSKYPGYRVYDWNINSVRTPKPMLIGPLLPPSPEKLRP